MRDEFVMLYEVYSKSGAFDEHVKSAHFVDFDTTVRDWIDHEQVACYERI